METVSTKNPSNKTNNFLFGKRQKKKRIIQKNDIVFLMVFKLTIGEVCKNLFYLIDWRDVDKLSVIISKVYELFSIFFCGNKHESQTTPSILFRII
jgi:hypothetical protein